MPPTSNAAGVARPARRPRPYVSAAVRRAGREAILSTIEDVVSGRDSASNPCTATYDVDVDVDGFDTAELDRAIEESLRLVSAGNVNVPAGDAAEESDFDVFAAEDSSSDDDEAASPPPRQIRPIVFGHCVPLPPVCRVQPMPRAGTSSAGADASTSHGGDSTSHGDDETQPISL